MEVTTKKAEQPVKSTVGAENMSWKAFNPKGEAAEFEFVKTDTLEALPALIKTALKTASANA